MKPKRYEIADVLRLLSGLVQKHGTQELAAEALGVSRHALYRTMAGKNPPAPDILAALELEAVTVYQAVKA